MNIFQEHYEKIAIGVGGLALIGGIFLGAQAIGASTKYVSENDGAGLGQAPKELLKEKVSKSIESIEINHVLEKKFDPITKKSELFLMKSVPLHGRKGQMELIDLLDESSKNVHKGVPNKWWFNNNLSTEMGYSNALELDSDGDGFSNKEEFVAKTNPSSSDEYPPLFPKLKLESVKAATFVLSFTESAGDTVTLKIRQNKPTFRHDHRMNPGDTGPLNTTTKNLGEFEKRFTYLKKAQAAPPGGRKQARITLKDHSSNDEELQVFRQEPLTVEDLTAYLYLDALGLQNEPAIALKKGDIFSLPFGKDKKTHKVIDITRKTATESKYTVTIADTKGNEKLLETR